ncbi:restriction endonuclease subunit S [Anaeromassilibacillus sp. An200]|uniref:restriction endonuclease subunit S n=1 Tax=Anaeromassilibacillus sp. An200 TaxID=1965587 RepID=UPI000B399246|nr:restriction endonuclease subunit S [Anaeromassilibacillus sp. An200]OUP07003.1 hypothetical protein B5F35_14850 [Anaeromassilibacillus sp. An200]
MARGKKKETLTPEDRLQAALVPESEQPYPVPGNWCWVYWGVCGDFQAGSAFKNEYQGLTEYKIPFYKVGSLKYSDSNGILYDASNTVNEEVRIKLKAALIPKNSIIFAKIGEAIRLNRRSINPVPCCIDNNLMSFHAKVCLTKYVYFWSLGIDLYNYTNATTVPAIRKSDLEKVAFPLAPSAEQQRIVDRIESLFAKLDEAKQKAQDALDSVETRKAAILHKAFTGELTAQWRKEHGVGMESWETKKYSEICNIVRGGSPRPAGSPEFYGGNIPFMKVADITRNTGPYVNSTEYTIKEAGLKKTRMVDRNTLLLTNSGATLGVPVICTFKTTFNDGIAAFLGLNPDTLLFHYYFWTSKTAALRAINKGAAQPNLNTDIIGNVEISLPRENEQCEIVRLLDNLLAKEQQAKESAEGVLEQIDLIKKAILARAFRGELGTNDPSEESAVELLKVIV